ncbi:hypothetical protein HF295_06445 [Hujiaoplasma nucleasis]|uniref:Uncharacterized protein n=1 Tax=Hujiaoplasma nucleasis TaxID=2725268 RepID=A0A7L6N7J2_9MOLU|nr:hypothetical protein [Hujiaoplasma nucleasis]QLY40509.1 hypothetical protein HF295_06445 [Hujiaoplasma nucleasis]
MATYTKGYKKQNSQLMLLKITLGVIGAVAILLLAAFIYDKSTDWKDYSSYDHLETYDQVLSQNQEDYVVYFYSTNTTSQDIKEDVLKVLNDLRKEDMTYLVEYSTETFKQRPVEDDETAYTRQSLLDDLDIDSITAPMIVVVANGELEEVILGTVNINKFLISIENDTYAPFNE